MANIFSKYVEQIATATKTLFTVKQELIKTNNLTLNRGFETRADNLRTQANRAAAARLVSGSSSTTNPTSSVIKRTRPF